MALKKPEWITIKEAADYLSIGEPTLYRWMRDNKITFRKIGDSTRFLQEDLDAAVQVFPAKGEAGKEQTFCPTCKSTNLVPGGMQSTGSLLFMPKKTKFWTFLDSSIKTTAMMCAECGTICLKGDTSKLSKLKPEEEAEEASE